jgi:tight adherence protein B
MMAGDGVLVVLICLAILVILARPTAGVTRRLRRPVRRSRPSVDLAGMRVRLDDLSVRRPRRLIAMAAVSAGSIAEVLGGPVAALVGAVYGALGARAWVRRVAKRGDDAARSRTLDDLSALAADLRAGLPPTEVAESFATGGVSRQAIRSGQRIRELTTAVWKLADHTGAPVADLVERIESDARAADRARASAAAEAAGSQATALLLAALPAGGIALGYGMGTDPLRVLLHTPLGGACAVAAVVLQLGGLLWADRLASGPVR